MHPFTPAPVQLRPMDLGDILDASFKVFRHAWKPMLLISLISAVPITLFSGAMGSYSAVDTSDPDPSSGMLRAIEAAEASDYSALGALAAIYIGYLLIYLLMIPLVNGALMTSIWDVVLGGTPTAKDSLRRTAPRYLALLGTTLLKGLGALLLIGPALLVIFLLSDFVSLIVLVMLALGAVQIVYFTYLAFTPHAVVLERVPGGLRAMKRSLGLVKGRFWPLLGLGVVYWFMTIALSYMINMITTIPMAFSLVAGGNLTQFFWLTAIANGISQALVVPILLTGQTLAYFDIRVRKEGLDLELFALAQRQFGTQPS